MKAKLKKKNCLNIQARQPSAAQMVRKKYQKQQKTKQKLKNNMKEKRGRPPKKGRNALTKLKDRRKSSKKNQALSAAAALENATVAALQVKGTPNSCPRVRNRPFPGCLSPL